MALEQVERAMVKIIALIFYIMFLFVTIPIMWGFIGTMESGIAKWIVVFAYICGIILTPYVVVKK